MLQDGKRTFSLAYGDKHEVVVQENEGKSKDEFFVNARGIADRYVNLDKVASDTPAYRSVAILRFSMVKL